MPEKRKVVVRIDDRVRLISAVLAATNYPDKSQDRKKHGTHLHSRGTRKLLFEYNHHPAVHALQVLLDQGLPLNAIYSYILRLPWPTLISDDMPRWVPPRWNEHLKHFYELTSLAKWWQDEADVWNLPLRHLTEIFDKVDLYTYLEPFFGLIAETFVFMPNISYPTDRNIGMRIGGELYVIVPPPIAWGDSPPWPYKDDPALAYRAALSEYISILLDAFLVEHEDFVRQISDKPLPLSQKYIAIHPSWDAQFQGVFTAGLTHIFLEDSVSSLEAKSYTQYMQRVDNLSELPAMVSILRRYLEEFHAGRFKSFAEYLPNLPKQLRVARTITAL